MGIDVDASLIASGKQELITNTVLRADYLADRISGAILHD